MFELEKVTHVIYHGPRCHDGYGARHAVERKLDQLKIDREVNYIPINYGQTLPHIPDGSQVIILDMSFSVEIMEDLIKRTELLIIDHHKTAEKDLASIPESNKIFDMDKSGAVLAWEYCFPDQETPLLYQYIQDRDLWRKELPNQEAYFKYICSQTIDFELFQKLIDEPEYLLTEIDKASAVVDYANQQIKQIVDYAKVKFQKINGRWFLVGYLKTSVHDSDACSALLKSKPLLDFVVKPTQQLTKNQTKFTLRSTDQNYDASIIAKSIHMVKGTTGGGHRNACGAATDGIFGRIPGPCVEDGQRIYQILTDLPQKITKLTMPWNDDSEEISCLSIHCPEDKRRLASYLLENIHTDRVENKDQAAARRYLTQKSFWDKLNPELFEAGQLALIKEDILKQFGSEAEVTDQLVFQKTCPELDPTKTIVMTWSYDPEQDLTEAIIKTGSDDLAKKYNELLGLAERNDDQKLRFQGLVKNLPLTNQLLITEEK